MNTNLGDRASQLFKATQALGESGILPDELGLNALTPLQFDGDSESALEFEGDGTPDLERAFLPNPVGDTQNALDLLRLIDSAVRTLSNPNLYLGEQFCENAQILAANIGATRPIISLPLVISEGGFRSYQARRNVRFHPGAVVDADYAFQIIASMRSTGLGDFVAVENRSGEHRVFYLGLRSTY